MNKENITQITNYLDSLGQKLGVGADYIWPHIIEQQVISFYIAASVAVICLALLLFSVAAWWKVTIRDIDSEKKDRWGGIYRSDIQMFFAGSMIVTGVMLFIALIAVIAHSPGYLNPEYGAFKDISRMTIK